MSKKCVRTAIVRESSILSRNFSRDLEKRVFSLFVTVFMFKRKMTPASLAACIGCTEKAVKYYVSGDRTPGLTLSSEIFKAFGVTSDDYVIFKRTVQASLDIQ